MKLKNKNKRNALYVVIAFFSNILLTSIIAIILHAKKDYSLIAIRESNIMNAFLMAALTIAVSVSITSIMESFIKKKIQNDPILSILSLNVTYGVAIFTLFIFNLMFGYGKGMLG
jgi:hypothetical protein